MDNLVTQVLIVAISGLAIAVTIVAITILTTKKEPTNAEAKSLLPGEGQAQAGIAGNQRPSGLNFDSLCEKGIIRSKHPILTKVAPIGQTSGDR